MEITMNPQIVKSWKRLFVNVMLLVTDSFMSQRKKLMETQAEIDRILLARDGAAAASPEGGAGNSSFDESELAAVAARAAEHSTAARIDAAEQLARPGAAEEK